MAAEEYLRAVYSGTNAWNLRDRRVEATVEATARHLQVQTGRPAKQVMWSPNSHTGDARATEAGARGELSLGELMKQRHGSNAYVVGFFTHGGTVLAAPRWESPGQVFDLRPALGESHSGLFHHTGMPAFALLLRNDQRLRAALAKPRLQRAVGVIYARDRERTAHYFEARLPDQFDAAIFFARSTAVKPL